MRLSPDSEARILLAFLGQGVFYALLGLAAAGVIRRRCRIPAWLVPITAAGAVALVGYIGLGVAFYSFRAGRIFSWLVLVAAAVVLTVRTLAERKMPPRDWMVPFALAGLIGAGYLSLAYLFKGLPFFELMCRRFTPNWPGDNRIPMIFADRLWLGQPLRPFAGDWLSSDRPPLQAGWLLLARPALAAVGWDGEATQGAGSVCFELLWVPALWAFFRRLGLPIRRAAALLAAISFSGIFVFYTLFTWPKFGAAAFVLAAFILWWTPAAPGRERARFALGGGCAALGMLAHGGVAFSLLGLAPLALGRLRRLRLWGWAALVFGLFLLPWLAYQKYADPPGNRLIKWHLAGVIPPDAKAFVPTLVDSYRRIGWAGAWANRRDNLTAQWAGEWPSPRQWFSSRFLADHRVEEIFFTARSFVWWLPFLLVLPWQAVRAARRGRPFAAWAASWWLLGWLTWLALMFISNQAVVHQGTLLTQVLGFALLAWSALALNRWAFLFAALLQAVTFLITWVPPLPSVAGAVDRLAASVAVICGALLLGIVAAGAGPLKAGRSGT